MRVRVSVAVCLAAAIAATAAAAQSSGEAGSGSALGSIQDIRRQLEQQWNEPPGKIVQGAAGVAGLAAALSAAREAVSLEGTMRNDGSVGGGSGIGGGDNGGGTTATSTTGTN